MECPECKSKNVEWIPYFPGTHDEPPAGPGYFCQDCGAWIPPEDEPTAKGW